jgi:hypothetical protein
LIHNNERPFSSVLKTIRVLNICENGGVFFQLQDERRRTASMALPEGDHVCIGGRRMQAMCYQAPHMMPH